MSSRLSPPMKKPKPFHVAVTQVASVGVLLGLSLVVWAYKRALEPQYATAPVLKHFGKIIWSCSILGSFAPTVPLPHATLALALLLYALPSSSYWVAAYTARLGDPQWGAVATHLVVLLPILSLGAAIVKALQELPYDKENSAQPMSGISMPVYATAISSLQGFWPSVPFVPDMPSSQIFNQLGTACLTLWAIAPFLPTISPPSPTAQAPATVPATLGKSKGKNKKGTADTPVSAFPPKLQKQKSGNLGKWRIAILPVLPFVSSVLRQPTLTRPLLEPYHHPSYPLRILSSAHSPYSGVIVVGESFAANPDQPDGNDYMRYLRAGHSLLGGVWVGPKAVALDPDLQLLDEAGEKLGDSVYSAFLVQEAALLVKRPGNQKWKNALIIGLGTGIAATSFMRHDIPTTIIEIDPAVYDAAKRFFGLPVPPPDKLFLQDARGWVRNRTRPFHADTTKERNAADIMEVEVSPDEQFDIVVHDCFSGGAVPGHLYTQEFWQDLKKIVKPDAVVAVNFAGSWTSDSAKAIIVTLRTVFPHCRAFHDGMDTSEHYATEFLNWVFFCTPSTAPLEFRTPVNSDFLGSYLRRHVLLNLPDREGDMSAVEEGLPAEKRDRFVLKDTWNPLNEWQQVQAMEHWKIMRGVFPDVYWETY